MTVSEFAERFMLNLPYDPTPQQYSLIAALSRFIAQRLPGDSAFILNGYAGTGKTTMVGGLVRTLRDIGVKTVLLAPTGRAAKVFSAAAGAPAYTIHRRIYRMPSVTSGMSEASLNVNRLRDAVFIVDEASMIPDNANERSGSSVLDDLLEFVYSGVNCRMILLGDTAQLPPVGYSQSPALSVERLKRAGLRVSRAVMTGVVRQDSDSGILLNATRLRRLMVRPPLPAPRFSVAAHSDVEVVEGHELADAISSAYSRDGVENTILITRSNRAASAANAVIRSGVLYSEEELCRGERLLVVKNNYRWSLPEQGVDFIANGDMATVEAIHSTETRHGFRFADVTLRLTHVDATFDCKVILDAITSDTAALPSDSYAELYRARLAAPDLCPAEATMRERLAALRIDPWFNALQVKYAYAVTCHKAQGGQWANVFVDTGGLMVPIDRNEGSQEQIDAEMLTLYRWLYTAVTRATSRLILVNPAESMLF